MRSSNSPDVAFQETTYCGSGYDTNTTVKVAYSSCFQSLQSEQQISLGAEGIGSIIESKYFHESTLLELHH